MSHTIDITFENSPHVDLAQILQQLLFLLSQVILLYDLQDNTLNLFPPTHFLRNLIHYRIHLVEIPLHYFHQTFKLLFFQETFFLSVLIPTPLLAHIKIPEYYTAEFSRPPTPIFVDYLIRVDGTTIYDPPHDPRFPIPTERFIANNDLLSHKRKETELKRLQNPNSQLKFEVKINFQGFNPHPVFHVAKREHKTTPAPFEVVHIDFERDPNLPSLTFGKIVFYNPYSGLEYTTSF